MKRNALMLLCVPLMAACLAACCPKQTVTMNVDVNQKGVDISPVLYGLFYEEINHAGEGGLYAELIKNRSFEEDDMMPFRRQRRNPEGQAAAGPRPDAGQSAQNPQQMITSWHLQVPEGCESSIILDKTASGQLNKIQKNALKWTVSKQGDAQKVLLKNEGFWGIASVKDCTYKLSFYARADKPYQGGLCVGLCNAQGDTVYAAATLSEEIGSKWQQYTANFTADNDCAQASFFMSLNQAGSIYLDMVSLFPPTYKNRENGMRPDLAEMLAVMQPKFIRFPGGCFVEGSSRETAYDWKITVGPVEERPGHWNLNWNYLSTDGFGYHEMLQLCEDLNAEPLYVVNIGIWHGGFQPYNQIDKYIQDAMDAIEYANGDAATKYGAMRIANGHAEPFNLKMIEVGNENYQPDARSQSDHYAERYIQFYQAIKKKYPDMQIIGNVESWGTDSPSWRNEHPVDLLDEHYYRTPTWFANHYNHYDNYDRQGPKIYAGEYAVTSDCGQGNLNAALGEAIFMMGMENNSDVVAMCSYAPIFVNWNNRHWMPDMIRFNSVKSYGSPSYWVQKLFSTEVGDYTLKSSVAVPAPQEKIHTYGIGLGTWSTAVDYKDAKVAFDGRIIDIPFGDWYQNRGEWQASDSVFSQVSNQENCVALYDGLKINSPRYTYTVKARKNSGNEGFLVLFNVENHGRYYWLNIGGWGNTQNAVESVSGNGKNSFSERPGRIEEGVWYDIRIEVDGKSIQCFLNDEPVSEFTIETPKTVYANALMDQDNHELVVKVVNFGPDVYPFDLQLEGAELAGKVAMTVLSSAEGLDENTMEAPLKIVPITTDVKPGKITLAPYSVNILRAKLK